MGVISHSQIEENISATLKDPSSTCSLNNLSCSSLASVYIRVNFSFKGYRDGLGNPLIELRRGCIQKMVCIGILFAGPIHFRGITFHWFQAGNVTHYRVELWRISMLWTLKTSYWDAFYKSSANLKTFVDLYNVFLLLQT